MKVKVLNSDLSGLNKYLIEQFRRDGHDVKIHEIPTPSYIKLASVIISYHPKLHIWRNRATEQFGRLMKTIHVVKWRSRFAEKFTLNKENKYDLILQFSGMFAPACDLRKLCVPYIIYTDYTMKLTEKYSPWQPFQSQRRRWYDWERTLYRNAAFVFCSNENTKKSLMADYGVPKQKAITAGCGFTFDEAKGKEIIRNKKQVLFVGLDFKRKGGEILLRSFKKVRKIIPDAQLVIVGPRKETALTNQPGVTLLGRINDRNRMKEIMTQSAIFVMPSFCEPFGLVFLEAMACRLPCIGTEVDAMSEIIVNGKTGYLVSVNDTDALAEKIIKLLTNYNLQRNMGDAGYSRLMNEFTWEKVMERIRFSINNVIF